MSFSKPPFGTPINTGSSLCSVLNPVGFYCLNENTGGLVNDGMRNLNLAATGFGSANPWGAGSQVGIYDTVSGGTFSAIATALQKSALPISIAVGFRRIGNVLGALIGTSASNSWSSPYLCYALEWQNSPNIWLSYNSAGSFTRLGGIFVSTSIDHVATGTITSSLQALYLDAILKASGSSALSNPTYSSSSSTIIGSRPTLGDNLNTIIYWACWSNTAWPASLHQFIGSNINNIYQIYSQSKPIFFSSQKNNSIWMSNMF